MIQPGQIGSSTSLIALRASGDPPNTSVEAAAGMQSQAQHKSVVNIDSAKGQPYVIYEGTILDGVLMNRLDGDAPGPVKVLVSNPVYSHDRQHVLIPEGTVALGEARKIGDAGFGQQRRMAVVFHRMIMPDGYSVDLDQFHGLDQAGEQGLKDKVNNHYMEIFGTSTALGRALFQPNRFTIERDQTNALYFLNGDVQRAVIDQERKDNIIADYCSDSSLPFVDVKVKNVILGDLRQSPYSAQFEFEKVFTNPADESVVKREEWTARVTYVFQGKVRNEELAVNPLGLSIVRFRADQAFE